MVIQILLGTIFSLITFGTPFLILKLTSFIKDGDKDEELSWESVKPGVIYSVILCFSMLISYLINEHQSYYNVLTGRRSSNAIIALIYQKNSKISAATNKDFSSGQIVNFVQVDAQRLYWFSY